MNTEIKTEVMNKFVDLGPQKEFVTISISSELTGEDICGGNFIRPTEADIEDALNRWVCFLRGWHPDSVKIRVVAPCIE